MCARVRVRVCERVRVRRTSGARRGVRVHTPAQSTAPLQCSVGLRTVFTRSVLRIYITRAALTTGPFSRKVVFWCIDNNNIFFFFYCVLICFPKKKIYIKYLKRASPTKHRDKRSRVSDEYNIVRCVRSYLIVD